MLLQAFPPLCSVMQPCGSLHARKSSRVHASACFPLSHVPVHHWRLLPPHSAAFKQQNAVRGLPLELSPEEVTLALEKGWAQLQPALGTAGALAQPPGGGGGGGGGRKRWRQEPDHSAAQEDDYGGYYGDHEAGTAHQQQEEQEQQQGEPAWRAALSDGAAFDIPTTPAEAAAANGSGASAGSGGDSGAPPPWSFPATEQEQHRYWVFRDLHSKG